MKRYIKTFISAILGGMCIGLGGTVFLALDNKVMGSLLFTVGLFTICIFGLDLYTGKVCYVFKNDKKYALGIPVIWLGNLLGTGAVAMVVRLTRLSPLSQKARELCEVKLSDSLLSVFLLAVLCNVCIYIGVEGYKTVPHSGGKCLALIFGVMTFILCSFEHCVANMFYFSAAWVWGPKAILYLLVMTVGNALGGVIFPCLRDLKEKLEK